MDQQYIIENLSDLNMIDEVGSWKSEVGRRKMEACGKVLINKTLSNDFKLIKINRNKKSGKKYLPDFFIF